MEAKHNIIEFDCPGCGAPMKIGPELIGRKLRCSDCGTKFVMEECDCYPSVEDAHDDIVELVEESEPTVQLPSPKAAKQARKKVVTGRKPVAKKKAVRLRPAKQRFPKA